MYSLLIEFASCQKEKKYLNSNEAVLMSSDTNHNKHTYVLLLFQTVWFCLDYLLCGTQEHFSFAVPLAPPQNLTITNYTADTVWLKWDPSPQPNGVIMRYNFKIYQNNTGKLFYQVCLQITVFNFLKYFFHALGTKYLTNILRVCYVPRIMKLPLNCCLRQFIFPYNMPSI